MTSCATVCGRSSLFDITMRWKLFVRSLSLSAPRVTVRSHAPWPLRAFLGFVVLAMAAAAGVALYEYGRQIAGPNVHVLSAEIEQLKAHLAEAQADRDRYSALAGAYESQLKIERAAQEELAQRVAGLDAESNRLREDLSFFESLLPATGASSGKGGVVIRSFRVQPEPATDSGTELRYRLLVQQSGKPERDFIGSVHLVVNYVLGARSAVLEVPAPGATEPTPALDLSFRHYQRLEGTFSLPVGAVAKLVQVRILSKGQTQVQQNFKL